MGQSGRVDHDRVGPPDRALDRVDDRAFMVRLNETDLSPPRGGVGPELILNLLQGVTTVLIRFPPTQEVQIGAIENEKPFRFGNLRGSPRGHLPTHERSSETGEEPRPSVHVTASLPPAQGTGGRPAASAPTPRSASARVSSEKASQGRPRSPPWIRQTPRRPRT